MMLEYGKRSTDKVAMFRFAPDGSTPCIFSEKSHLIEDILLSLECEQSFSVSVVYMSRDEYDKLPEHKGY